MELVAKKSYTFVWLKGSWMIKRLIGKQSPVDHLFTDLFYQPCSNKKLMIWENTPHFWTSFNWNMLFLIVISISCFEWSNFFKRNIFSMQKIYIYGRLPVRHIEIISICRNLVLTISMYFLKTRFKSKNHDLIRNIDLILKISI